MSHLVCWFVMHYYQVACKRDAERQIYSQFSLQFQLNSMLIYIKLNFVLYTYTHIKHMTISYPLTLYLTSFFLHFANIENVPQIIYTLQMNVLYIENRACNYS